MKVSRKAAAILRWVARHIVEDPRRFDMAHWADRRKGPPCGTTGCIAGWCMLKDFSPTKIKKTPLEKLVPDISWNGGVLAAEKLGFSEYELGTLFYEDEWPEPFRTNFEEAHYSDRPTRQAELAKIAAKRIHHFIRTGK